MASGLKTAEAARLVNASAHADAYATQTPPTKVELTTTAPTNSTNGTPVSGGSYSAQPFVQNTPTATASIANGAVISFGPMPATTVVGADLKDSNASPRYSWWGTFATPISTLVGDMISFAVGAITFSLNNTP